MNQTAVQTGMGDAEMGEAGRAERFPSAGRRGLLNALRRAQASARSTSENFGGNLEQAGLMLVITFIRQSCR